MTETTNPFTASMDGTPGAYEANPTGNTTDAFFAGYAAGLHQRNPHHWATACASAWEDGYRCGRTDHERSKGARK
jgi:hypothetical protein